MAGDEHRTMMHRLKLFALTHRETMTRLSGFFVLRCEDHPASKDTTACIEYYLRVLGSIEPRMLDFSTVIHCYDLGANAIFGWNFDRSNEGGNARIFMGKYP
jgi:hypothetical protein